MSEIDIEELHQCAVQNGSRTYIDPATGFTVFTEITHLTRGKCCGNMCRHCPYGWENVSSADESQKREAKVKSGDKEEASKLLQQLISGKSRTASTSSVILKNNKIPKESKRIEERKTIDCAGISSKINRLSYDDDTKNRNTSDKRKNTGLGGRRGGTFTKKNVPYTRSGDKGTTVLLTGERRRKDDPAFEAMGNVDELCSFVGSVHAELLGGSNDPSINYGDLPEWLVDIMSRLFDMGSHVAKPKKITPKSCDDDDEDEDDEKDGFKANGIGDGFDSVHIENLELWIDDMTEELPELTSFILPTGGQASAKLHIARTVCRRVERSVVCLVEDGVCDPSAMQYLNRLSDFFFTASRWTNYCEGREEILYKKPSRTSKQRNHVTVSLQKK